MSSLQELLNMKNPTSKQSLRAGRSISLLLSSFYDYPSFKDYTFQNWLETHLFLNFVHKSYNMLAEIEQLKIKCEHPKAVRNQATYELLKKEMRLHQIELGETIKSPKVQNFQYKPIFGFIFYLLSFMSLKKVHDQQRLSQRVSLSSSRSKSPVI